MISVADVLSLPLLSNIRIYAGKNGLSNPVLHAGFFEWEELSDIPKYFEEDELIITTLSSAKDDSLASEKIISSLIHNRPAAIFIKDVFFSDSSEYIRHLADKKCVPVVFFSDAYIDRLFHAVYQLIISEPCIRIIYFFVWTNLKPILVYSAAIRCRFS